jgi:ribosomal protein S8
MYKILNKKIIIFLRYIKNKPLFLKIKFISTSGFRQYLSKKSIPFFKKNLGGHARILLNTSYGLLNLNIVEKLVIGGEISYILYE